MFTTLKNVRTRLFLALTVLALVAAAATAAYANEIFPYPEANSGSTTYWVSCGSSAGNYVYKCDASHCEACPTPECNTTANRVCARHGYPPTELPPDN